MKTFAKTLLVFLLLLTSCNDNGRLDLAETFTRSDGNLIFREGVECLGEDAQPLSGKDIFISVGGDDSNPGTESKPLKTLAHAICNLSPGQTLNISPGVYHDIVLGEFGSSNAPITIRAIPGAPRPGW